MIDVVIVNWNSGNQLAACIDSVERNSCDEVSAVIVVDNGSTDGSLVDEGYSKLLTIIKSGVNLGFGKACNLGAKGGQSEYILFLNPDACLYEQTLSRAMDFIRSEKSNLGILGVGLVDEAGVVARSCARFPTPFRLISHAIGLSRFFPLSGSPMREWDHKETRDVDQVIGAFFLVRRDLFESLNGFDERFFVYFEEVDFARRAKSAGWRSVYLADAQAFHSGGGTSNNVKARRLFYSLRSRLLYSFKHFSLIGAFLVSLATFFLEPLSRSLLNIIRCSWSGLRETWAGYGMLMAWVFNIRQKQ